MKSNVEGLVWAVNYKCDPFLCRVVETRKWLTTVRLNDGTELNVHKENIYKHPYLAMARAEEMRREFEVKYKRW